MKVSRLLRLLVLLPVFQALAVSAAPEQEILVSIKPLAMLVQGVVGDTLPVKVLMPGNVSPHDFSLKFSDLRSLNQAGLVVWVGPELESPLRKPLAEEGGRVLQLSVLPELQWPAPDQEEDDHLQAADEHHDHEDHHYGKDPHLWLNPANARVVARAIEGQLSQLFPVHAALFRGNLQQFLVALDDFDRRAEDHLAPLRNRGFVVTHDGYGHFVQYFGLQQLASIQLGSGQHQGARHYAEMLSLGQAVTCVFAEPQLNSKAAAHLATQLGAKLGELDPLGREIPLGESSYLAFMDDLVNRFSTCLTP